MTCNHSLLALNVANGPLSSCWVTCHSACLHGSGLHAILEHVRISPLDQLFVILTLRRENCDLVLRVLCDLKQLQVWEVRTLTNFNEFTDKPILSVDELDSRLISHKDIRHFVGVEIRSKLSSDDARFPITGPCLLFSFGAFSIDKVEMRSFMLESQD